LRSKIRFSRLAFTAIPEREKTTFASTAPKPALIIKGEEGTNSVYDVEGIDDVPIFKPDDILEITNSSTVLKYATVILDTATMVQEMVLAEILGIDELPAQMSWGISYATTMGPM
jgi:hypothetical protein